MKDLEVLVPIAVDIVEVVLDAILQKACQQSETLFDKDVVILTGRLGARACIGKNPRPLSAMSSCAGFLYRTIACGEDPPHLAFRFVQGIAPENFASI